MHDPVTLSSKPSAHAKQMEPLGSQSLQLLGQTMAVVATRRRVRRILLFMIIILRFFCDGK